jgi:phosphoribosylaminoimidazolecarboxamide formyltransferase/IMP cyclohydrolase
VFKRAYACDPISAFGGIVAINGTVDAQVAAFIRSEKLFVECLVAGGFTDAALAELAPRKNLRLLPWNQVRAAAAPVLAREVRSLHGGLLVQEWDAVASEDYKAVTNSIPSDGQKRDMQFAAKIAKCTKSNTLVYAKNGATIAIGAGQMSRIDCVGIAAHKLKHSNLKNAHLVDSPLSFKGAVLASDAFFPFPDVAEESAKLGVSAIIQPGGSKNDQMSIEACNNQGIAMVFSGERHFRH